MDAERMSAALTDAFNPNIRRTIIRVLDEAYQVAGARYDETLGCNGFTFGTDLYQFVKYRLQGRGDEAAAPIALGETSTELELRLKIGPFNVACHRVGTSASQDIAECFPSSSGGPARLARLNAVQLELPLGWTATSALVTNVVIAHLGNPDHGLEAVYVAVPVGVSESGRINGWVYTQLMWRWDGQDSDYVPATVDLPPAVPIEDTTVELRDELRDSEDVSS